MNIEAKLERMQSNFLSDITRAEFNESSLKSASCFRKGIQFKMGPDK